MAYLSTYHLPHRLKVFYIFLPCWLLLVAGGCSSSVNTDANDLKVKTQAGTLEGQEVDGIYHFKGVPFAEAPTGSLRWQPPQPVAPWQGVRSAQDYAPRCMQLPIYSDMQFRSPDISEDCLYLNIWAKPTSKLKPVLVYFHGGGFIAGSGDENRYDGASMAQRDIVVVTVNYRLGIFGFFAHPELSAQSEHGVSGNYGLMDQIAALKWVRENIAQFGGDPDHIVIGGESAGSISVSALMVSPLSRELIAGAIGQSGSLLGLAQSERTLKQGEAAGLSVQRALDKPSLQTLYATPAQQLLESTQTLDLPRFWPIIDGYVLPQDARDLYESGSFSRVPLLTGVNSQEAPFYSLIAQVPEQPKAAVDEYKRVLAQLYPRDADEVFSAYPASDPESVKDAAQALAGDRFLGHSNWLWANTVAQHQSDKVYSYLFSRPRPAPSTERGAVHSAEIEYVLGNLFGNPVYEWEARDRQVAEYAQSYFAAFIKKLEPSVEGLPAWKPLSSGQRMVIDTQLRMEDMREQDKRHRLLKRISEKSE